MAISSCIFCNLSFRFFLQYVTQYSVNSLVVKLSNNQPTCIDYKPSLNVIDGSWYSKHDHYFWHCQYCAFPNIAFKKNWICIWNVVLVKTWGDGQFQNYSHVAAQICTFRSIKNWKSLESWTTRTLSIHQIMDTIWDNLALWRASHFLLSLMWEFHSLYGAQILNLAQCEYNK